MLNNVSSINSIYNIIVNDVWVLAFLCAFNGFAEFYTESTVRAILGWQKAESGCFAFDVYGRDTDPLYWPKEEGQRMRRSALQLADNCSDHMSGLALAAMTQFLKFGLLNV